MFLDQPTYLFPVPGRPDVETAKFHECDDAISASDLFAPHPHADAGTVSDPESQSAEGNVDNQGVVDETTLPTGTALERLNAYMNADFVKIDQDQNGTLSKSELEGSLATMTNKDEMQLLSWMGNNIEALQKLGDRQSGFSLEDLGGLDRAVNQGTGDIGFALRNVDWLVRGGISAAGSYGSAAAAKAFFNIPTSNKAALGYTLASFVGLTAIDTAGYYLFDRPKIDKAINELSGLTDLAANLSK